MNTTYELIRSWPLQSRHFLHVKLNQSISKSKEESNKELFFVKATKLYQEQLRDLYSGKLVPFDVSFRIGDKSLDAHRCIVESKCEALRKAIKEAELPGRVCGCGDKNILQVKLSNIGCQKHPKLVEDLVKLCYGGSSECFLAQIKQEEDILSLLGKEFKVDSSNKLMSTERFLSKPDVHLVGRIAGKDVTSIVWRIPVHSAIICAHSEYARSLFTHGWNVETTNTTDGEIRLITLDASQFSKDVVLALIQACYTKSLKGCSQKSTNKFYLTLKTIGFDKMIPCILTQLQDRSENSKKSKLLFLLELYNASRYLQVSVVTNLVCDAMQYELSNEHVVEIMSYAHSIHADDLIEICICFASQHLTDLHKNGILKFVHENLMLKIISSEDIEAEEDKILEAVLAYCEGKSLEYSKRLVSKVRLAFVPAGCDLMQTALSRNLIQKEEWLLNEKFQNDEDYRLRAMDIDPTCMLRRNIHNKYRIRTAVFFPHM